MSGWVYLLREREFVNSGIEVCKVGRSGNWLKRFKQYPKGSVLIFCMFCADVVAAERESILTLTRNFKARKDIGSESFEGDTRSMVGAIAALLSARSFLGPELVVGGEIATRLCYDEPLHPPDDDGVTTTAARDEADSSEPNVAASAYIIVVKQKGRSSADLVADDLVRAEEGADGDVAEVPLPPSPAKPMVHEDLAIARFIDTLGSRDGLRVLSLDLFGQFLDYVSGQKEWRTTAVGHPKFSKALVHNYGAISEVFRHGAGTDRFIVFPRRSPHEAVF